jgi:hypothetical protein
MGRKERESKSEIAGFGGLNLPFPAISNRPESEKKTPAQSLRTLFTDDQIARGAAANTAFAGTTAYPARCFSYAFRCVYAMRSFGTGTLAASARAMRSPMT